MALCLGVAGTLVKAPFIGGERSESQDRFVLSLSMNLG
jgi:hypothetical protein